MPKWVIPAAIVVLVVLLVVAPVTGTYNSLVAANQQVDAGWANVEAQYQRRLDLIPNLVEATRGFLTQERTIFEDLAKARSRYAGSPAGSSERVAAANQVESALARLLVIVENYPTLRSSDVVQRLMSELASTENEIAAARQAYNQQVRQYNTRLKTFPTVLMARSLGFSEKPYFISAAEARQAPKVNLTNP
jgi:LemA protein